MEEVYQLRCLLEQGKLIQQMMTAATILLFVEVAICIQAIIRYNLRQN